MFKFKADTNVINKKSIILIIVSFLTTYFLTKNSKNKNRKKKSKIHTFKKTYSFFDGLISNTNNKIIANEINKDNNEIKIEEAIIFDI